MIHPHVSIITLGVADLAAATAFYQHGLGLPLRSQDSNEFISFFQLNGLLLALYPSDLLADDAGVPHNKGQFSGITLAHNVNTQAEVDRILALATDAGATLVKPTEHKDWGGYSGYFQDRDGHLWEIAWSPDLVVDEH